MPIDALSVLCAQLTRDLLAIAKFLLWLLYLFYPLLSSRSRQGERLSASMLSICLSVCLSVCLFVFLSVAKMQKRDFLKN